MPTPKTGYVYFIGSGKFGWYKIGKSKRPKLRVKHLGILLPFRVELFALWQTSNCDLLERLMHEKYQQSGINGEWFSFHSWEAEAIIVESQPFDAIRTFPANDGNLESPSYSNIIKDIIKSKDIEAKKERQAQFKRRALNWLFERGMDDTKENRKTAYIEMGKKAAETRRLYQKHLM